MSAAAKSVFYFAIYLYFLSVQLIFVPNLFLKMFQLPPTEEVWIRVVGVLVGAIAFYYHQSAVKQIEAFFPLTVAVRVFVFLSFIAFVVVKFASPVFILFGTIDLAGAFWTWRSLQKQAVLTT